MTNVAEDAKVPRIYEASFLITPSLPEEKLLALTASIKDVILSRQAIILSEEMPKMRALAYTVERTAQGRVYKYDTAYFGWLKFEGDPDLLPLLKEFLEKSEHVIRFLLIKTVRENTMASLKFIHAIRTDDGKEPRREVKREPSAEPAAPKMTTEELDKTIEELVVE